MVQQADVLLVTATAVETMAVRRLFPKVDRHFIGNKTYYDLGEVGGVKVFLVQSEMGAGGQGGAMLTIQRGIDTLSPSSVIMVGIAFGVDPNKQQLGDILVSQQILDYELQRVSNGPDHTLRIISRGDKAAASLKLLDRFRDGEMEWVEAKEQARVKFGLILSGAKLVDNQDFREQLRAFGPEAIGGEMEGAGLYAAAQSNKIDWILVKAICDWADGNKNDNEHGNQELAATNAARFVIHVIKQGGLQSASSQNRSQATIQPNLSNAANADGQKQPLVQKVNGTEPLNVFISYSAEDEKFKKQLETHLALLRRSGTIRPWSSHELKPGLGRDQEIARLINVAQIILLLISPNFLAEDDTYEKEMMRAIDRNKRREAVRVIPIKIHEVPYGDPSVAPFQGLQSLPRSGKPVDAWRNADEIWAAIANDIRLVCNDLNGISDKK